VLTKSADADYGELTPTYWRTYLVPKFLGSSAFTTYYILKKASWNLLGLSDLTTYYQQLLQEMDLLQVFSIKQQTFLPAKGDLIPEQAGRTSGAGC
jgi:hypothetical protein